MSIKRDHSSGIIGVRPFQSEARCCALIWQPPLDGYFIGGKMKKIFGSIFVLGIGMLAASPAVFAQAAAPAAAAGPNWGVVAACFGMALAAFGGALGQARVASAACEGMARNPGAVGAIRAAMILGLVFIETLALLTLVIIFAKV
jgi:F-type H+-transporting ATPase subunit c